MTVWRITLVVVAILGAITADAPALHAQSTTLEYRVKAAYLYNFTRYVEWPATAPADGPVTICVADHNPFGDVLEETVRGERLGGRALTSKVVVEPDPSCHVLFIPAGVSASAYWRPGRTDPMLVVGESADFIALGGMVNFVLDGPNVRFEIDQSAAERAGLRISSRLLRLARDPRMRTQ